MHLAALVGVLCGHITTPHLSTTARILAAPGSITSQPEHGTLAISHGRRQEHLATTAYRVEIAGTSVSKAGSLAF